MGNNTAGNSKFVKNRKKTALKNCMASQSNNRHIGCIGDYVMYSSLWTELRNGFKGFAELGLEGSAEKTRFLEKSSAYIGSSPPTSMFKKILIIPVFHISCWGFLSLPFPKTITFYKKAHFRNCISLPKYKIFWLFLHLLSECERTFVNGSGEDCKWLSDPSKYAFVFLAESCELATFKLWPKMQLQSKLWYLSPPGEAAYLNICSQQGRIISQEPKVWLFRQQ